MWCARSGRSAFAGLARFFRSIGRLHTTVPSELGRPRSSNAFARLPRCVCDTAIGGFMCFFDVREGGSTPNGYGDYIGRSACHCATSRRSGECGQSCAKDAPFPPRNFKAALKKAHFPPDGGSRHTPEALIAVGCQHRRPQGAELRTSNGRPQHSPDPCALWNAPPLIGVTSSK